MSFTIHTNYLDYIASLPLANEKIGIFKAGRYCGFDKIISNPSGFGDIPISLGHDLTGMVASTFDNEAGDLMGSVVTAHGVIVKTADVSNLGISENTSGNPRIDIVYLEHTWVEANPGSQPFIGILQGEEDGEEPPLLFPAIQVRIGKIIVPGDATTFADITYVPDAVPTLGGIPLLENHPELYTTFAKLAGGNVITGVQVHSHYQLNLYNPLAGRLTLPVAGNYFIIDGQGLDHNITGFTFTGIDPDVITWLRPGLHLTLIFRNMGSGSTIDIRNSLNILEVGVHDPIPTSPPDKISLDMGMGQFSLELQFKEWFDGGTGYIWTVTNMYTYTMEILYQLWNRVYDTALTICPLTVRTPPSTGQLRTYKKQGTVNLLGNVVFTVTPGHMTDEIEIATILSYRPLQHIRQLIMATAGNTTDTLLMQIRLDSNTGKVYARMLPDIGQIISDYVYSAYVNIFYTSN